MSWEINRIRSILSAHGQTWQGHDFCLGKTQLVDSLIALTFLQICSGSPVEGSQTLQAEYQGDEERSSC